MIEVKRVLVLVIKWQQTNTYQINRAKLTALLVHIKVDVLFSTLSRKHSDESSKVEEESHQLHG